MGTCDPVLPLLTALTMTCDDFAHFDQAQIRAQVFHRLATKRNLTQVGLVSVSFSLGLARTRLHCNGFFASCVQFASTCDSVGRPSRLCAQVGISKLAVTFDFVSPRLNTEVI